jgi:hypothetical protein
MKALLTFAAVAAASPVFAPPGRAEGTAVASVSFADEIAAGMPPSMAMPAQIREALDWLEQNGAVGRQGNDPNGQRYAMLYPADSGVDEDLKSLVWFSVFEDFNYDYMNLPLDAVKQRLFLFVTTGGDGSSAGLWLDDTGQMHFVHLGSGSGSVWFGIITDDPVDFLRFLAIGYGEPAFDNYHALTPDEEWAAANGEDIADREELIEDGEWEATVAPEAFQDFLAARFGVTIPARAADLLGPKRDDDSFARWLKEISE